MSTVRNTLALLVLAAGTAAAHADVVTDWNSAYLDAIRATPGGSEQARGGPYAIARDGAILHAAIYDAINSIDRRANAYSVVLDGTGADRRAAAAAAGYTVMSTLYASNPALQNQFTQLYQTQISAINNAAARQAGIALGQQVASTILSQRANDGANVNATYTPGSGPGHYQGNFPPNAAALGSSWPTAQTFSLNSASQFRPVAPPALNSAQYTAAYNQVRDFGGRNSTVRTADQTQIAWFWANDRDGTSKPPGQLNQMTQVIAAQQFVGMSEDERLFQNARVFALTNIAMADAAIAAWDAKYATDLDFWRPIEGIRAGDSDGNADTVGDATWEPLSHGGIGGDPYTPPFPAYISGHSTFAGAHAAVLQAFFGTDNISFDLGTDDPDAVGVIRHFDTISSAAEENAHSRIYLGVHWLFDCDAGLLTGTAVGDWVMSNSMTIPAPTSAAALAFGLIGASRRRRS